MARRLGRRGEVREGAQGLLGISIAIYSGSMDVSRRKFSVLADHKAAAHSQKSFGARMHFSSRTARQNRQSKSARTSSHCNAKRESALHS